jgi:3-deoxy-D-manno-octulosonic-acid transferase
LIGPHTWNFSEAAEQSVAAGAALRVANGEDMLTALRELHDDVPTRQLMARAGQIFTELNRGATARTLDLVEASWVDAGTMPSAK